jgi:hypothetical protein
MILIGFSQSNTRRQCKGNDQAKAHSKHTFNNDIIPFIVKNSRLPKRGLSDFEQEKPFALRTSLAVVTPTPFYELTT